MNPLPSRQGVWGQTFKIQRWIYNVMDVPWGPRCDALSDSYGQGIAHSSASPFEISWDRGKFLVIGPEPVFRAAMNDPFPAKL